MEAIKHLAGKAFRGLLVAVPGGREGLEQFLRALAFEGGNLHHRAAQFLGQLPGINGVPALAHQVHHVQRDDHRQAQLKQLEGQKQVALQVGSVYHVQDDIGLLFCEVVAGDDFLWRIGRQGVHTRQVLQGQVTFAADEAFLLFDGDPGPVANVLVGTGEVVKQRSLAAVGVSGQGDNHGRLLPFVISIG